MPGENEDGRSDEDGPAAVMKMDEPQCRHNMKIKDDRPCSHASRTQIAPMSRYIPQTTQRSS